MFASFATFGVSEWLRLVFTVMLCIPLLIGGMYLFGLFPDIISGKDTAKRKRRTDEEEASPKNAETLRERNADQPKESQ